MRVVLGMDFGGSKIALAICDLDGAAWLSTRWPPAPNMAGQQCCNGGFRGARPCSTN
jgi:predicted NBD/HSP70 family sugar kinase